MPTLPPPGLELDEYVGNLLGADKTKSVYYIEYDNAGNATPSWKHFPYSTDITAAFRAIENCPHRYFRLTHERMIWEVIWDGELADEALGATTLPYAICLGVIRKIEKNKIKNASLAIKQDQR